MDTTDPLSKELIKCMQDIVGTLLCYGRVVDPTILLTTSAKVSQQAQGMEDVANACHQYLDHVATHPNAGICYLASNMIIAFHIKASCLSDHNACSQVSAHFYLTNEGNKKINNGTGLNLASFIKHVMSLALWKNWGLSIVAARLQYPF
jgi:hypothetical protein